jgi:hypothetical protein
VIGLPTRQSVSTVAPKNACPNCRVSVIAAQIAAGSALIGPLAAAASLSPMRLVLLSTLSWARGLAAFVALSHYVRQGMC